MKNSFPDEKKKLESAMGMVYGEILLVKKPIVRPEQRCAGQANLNSQSPQLHLHSWVGAVVLSSLAASLEKESILSNNRCC